MSFLALARAAKMHSFALVEQYLSNTIYLCHILVGNLVIECWLMAE